MSVFKTTFSRALSVIKSDNSNIPFPSNTISGVTTNSGPSVLIDDNAFFTDKVNVGDIVYSTSNSVSAIVIKIVDENTLLLNANVFSLGYSYTIYPSSSQTGFPNPGCFLYVGGAGNVSVVTVGGDEIIFNGVPAGTTLPIQVVKLKETGTTATAINALW